MAGSALQAIQAAQAATLSQSVIKAAGAGKAYQSVALSTAIAVQDGTDYLRNVTSICTTAFGMFMIRFAATQNAKDLENAIKSLTPIDTATQQFQKIGTAAGNVLKGFPSG